ncbi:MAG: S24 family peptidase [Anaerolineales bacterium]
MEPVKGNCDQWINFAYNNWLVWERDEKRKGYLRESTRILVDRMKGAANQKKHEEALNLLERLKRLGNNFNQLEEEFGSKSYLYEHAEIYMECALTAYSMDDLQEAISLFKISINGFPNRTMYKAISYWLYGCIQWQSQSHREDALISWEKGLQIFKDVQSDNNYDADYSKKCTGIIDEAQKGIKSASTNNYPPPPPEPTSAKAPSKPQKSKIQMFPIIGAIPAGSPISIVDDSEERTISDGFEINNEHYSVYKLQEKSEINFSPSKRYYLLRVSGDSMNNASPVTIENGDYVLMVKQDEAKNGEIVAADIKNVDYEATLKRYYFKNGEHILRPESKDNSLKEHLTFKNDFVIRGIAIAVLKHDA